MSLPIKEFDFKFARSSGSGGQNVNKINSKVTLVWKVKKSNFFSNAVATRFFSLFSTYITDDGVLNITSQRFRSQGRNTADCLEKLQIMIDKAKKIPKKRKATKPTKSSIEKRIKDKKNRSKTKSIRREKF